MANHGGFVAGNTCVNSTSTTWTRRGLDFWNQSQAGRVRVPCRALAVCRLNTLLLSGFRDPWQAGRQAGTFTAMVSGRAFGETPIAAGTLDMCASLCRAATASDQPHGQDPVMFDQSLNSGHFSLAFHLLRDTSTEQASSRRIRRQAANGYRRIRFPRDEVKTP